MLLIRFSVFLFVVFGGNLRCGYCFFGCLYEMDVGGCVASCVGFGDCGC